MTINNIFLFLIGIIVLLLFTNIRKHILTVFKNIVKIIWKTKQTQKQQLKDNIHNASIGKVYLSPNYSQDTEVFNIIKFKKMFTLNDTVEWIKSIKEIIDGRKIVIYIIIVTITWGILKYNAKQQAPVDFKFNYEAEITLEIPKQARKFYKPKNSNRAYWLDYKGNKLDTVRVKDVEELKRALKPFGIEIKPIGVVGAGASVQEQNLEIGAGISWLRYYQWRLDSFLTNKGVYPFGVSYKMTKLTENSSIGLGVGKGYKGDNRALLYFKVEF